MAFAGGARNRLNSRFQPQAILFDVDGTLYRQRPVFRAILWRLAVFGFRHPLQCQRHLRAVRAYRHAQEWLRANPGDSLNLAASQIHRAAAATGLEESEIRQAVHRWMETAPLDLLQAARTPGLLEFLREVRSGGLRTGAVSDYPAHAKLAALGVRDLFDAVVCAQDAGVQVFKPEPAGIQLALQQLGVTPENAVYIGDRPEVDGEAARRAGVRFVRIGPADGYGTVAAAIASRG